MPEPWQSIITFLSGGLVGTILGFLLDLGRDARNNRRADKLAAQGRKTDFLAFVTVWDAEVVANRRKVNSSNVFVTVSGEFDSKRLQLIANATGLKSDYQSSERTAFEKSVKAITDMTPGQVDGEDGRKNLSKAICNLASFVEKN